VLNAWGGAAVAGLAWSDISVSMQLAFITSFVAWLFSLHPPRPPHLGHSIATTSGSSAAHGVHGGQTRGGVQIVQMMTACACAG
jgi:hypothetical protein